jgi:hypothetical protein
MADPAAKEDPKVDKSSEQKPQDNTSPGLDPTPDSKVQVSAVNPPITPDQVVSMAEAPSSAVTLPDVKLQNIKISPVKNKTIQGHLAAIEAKMIATEKLMKDIVKLQKNQIKTDKDLHYRRKELYQNTSQEFLLDKTIDFRDPKDKDCTCINIPKKKKGGFPLPFALPPGGGPITAPTFENVPDDVKGDIKDPVTDPVNKPVDVPETPVDPVTPPVNTPPPPVEPPDWLKPGGFPIPPIPLGPGFGLPGLPGMPRADLPGDLTPTPGFAIDFSDPFNVPDMGPISGLDLSPEAYEQFKNKPEIQNIIEELKQPSITDQAREALFQTVVNLASAEPDLGDAVKVASFLFEFAKLGANIGGSLIGGGLIEARAKGGIIPYASGGVPSGGRDIDLYHSTSQEYFRDVSSKLEIPKFAGGGLLDMLTPPWAKPKGLSTAGARPGFTGMNAQGYNAITGGDKFRPGGFKPQILGRGAYSAPTQQGAMRYAGGQSSLGMPQQPGGVVKTIVPGGASRFPFLEQQMKVKPTTFDKGRVLANKVQSGAYPKSNLAGRLRSGMRMGGAPMRMGMGIGRIPKLSHPFVMLAEMIMHELGSPQSTATYDQVTGPNAYFNAPGYDGPMPSQNLENAQTNMMQSDNNATTSVVPLPPNYIQLPGKPKEKTYDTFEVPGIDLEPSMFTRPSRYID